MRPYDHTAREERERDHTIIQRERETIRPYDIQRDRRERERERDHTARERERETIRP